MKQYLVVDASFLPDRITIALMTTGVPVVWCQQAKDIRLKTLALNVILLISIIKITYHLIKSRDKDTSWSIDCPNNVEFYIVPKIQKYTKYYWKLTIKSKVKL